MTLRQKITTFVLFLADIATLYLSLLAALVLRYGSNFYEQLILWHLTPFTAIFFVWIIIFYVAGLYDLRRLRDTIDFLKTLWLAIVINTFFSIAFFYLIPAFGITPKTNLFLFAAIFTIIETLWRRTFNRHARFGEAANVLLIGQGSTAEAINASIQTNPQLGYAIQEWIRKDDVNGEIEALRTKLTTHAIDVLIIPRHFKKDSRLARAVYDLLTLGVEVHDLTNFYELVIRKVPLADLEEAWFLENLIGHQKFYDQLKRALELAFAFLLGIVLLPLEILIALLVKITSPGPVIYAQTRIGKNNKPFTLYKFRTMRADAERDGARWSKPKDARVTPFGKFLRYSHLDELPQLVNIMRGNVSFVGPRPERPEFVTLLTSEIPHYEIRHLIAPGITGWAQVNFRYGASVEDAYEKLQYDLYYLKNRSLILDAAIILRTLRSFFVNQK